MKIKNKDRNNIKNKNNNQNKLKNFNLIGMEINEKNNRINKQN